VNCMDGFKPLRWDCDKDGCFNKKHRLDFSAFYTALPNRISFSDVDGIVEIAGNGLMLEWKDRPAALPKGQEIMFKRLSKGAALSVLCLAGDASTMTVTHCGRWFDGNWRPWEVSTTADVNMHIRKWVVWANRHPRFGGK
jgi:hypothetical protein